MKNTKRTISFMLSVLILFLLCADTTVLANERQEVPDYQSMIISEETYSSDEVYLELQNIGFTDDEILDLYQKESNKTKQDLKLPNLLYEITGKSYVYSKSTGIELFAFPKKPRIGEWHTEHYNINFNTVARKMGWAGGGTGIAYILAKGSKTALAKAIVSSSGLGSFSSAVSIASVIFGEASRYHNGTTVSVEYLYTYNNDYYLTWVVGPISCRFW